MCCFPGLSHTPLSEKSEISFKMSEAASYMKYIEKMNELLKKYNDTHQMTDLKFEDCGGKYKLIVTLPCEV